MDYTDRVVIRDVIDEAREYLRANLKPSRIEHTERVVKTAQKLAERFGGDVKKATVSSWFHDMAKNMAQDLMDSYIIAFDLDRRLLGRPNLAHAKIAAELMRRDFGIDDEDVIAAVSYHTTGRAAMSLLEKIVFIADITEPGRTAHDIDEIRGVLATDLDKACLTALEKNIEFVRNRGMYLDPDTIKARDYFRSLIESGS